MHARGFSTTSGGYSQQWVTEQRGLRQRCPERLAVITGEGLGGETRGEITRIPTLRLGDYILTNTFAEFEMATDAPSHDEIAGFVGSQVLRKFNLTFDVERSGVWIEPNSNYLTDSTPPGCVRSGMVCVCRGSAWIVRDLIPGSPADKAGISVGDRLLEIDGVPVQTMSGRAVKRAFQAQPGTQVQLRVKSSARESREVILILRDLL